MPDPLPSRDREGANDRDELERRIQQLEQQLEKEQELRAELEGRLQLQQTQLLELSRSIRSILRSRIWRVLSAVGGRFRPLLIAGTLPAYRTETAFPLTFRHSDYRISITTYFMKGE